MNSKWSIILFFSLLLFISSCRTSNNHNVQNNSHEQSYLSQISDANVLSEEYIKRMEKYDRILSDSPIPVFILDTDQFAQDIFLKISDPILKEKLVGMNFLGAYINNQNIEGKPAQFIFINKKLTPEQIVVTYFHEIGHYYHIENKCQGCIKSPVTREQHALYNEIEMGWKHNDPFLIESSIRTMAIYATEKDSNIVYRMATFEVMNTDLWKQSINFLKIKEKGHF